MRTIRFIIDSYNSHINEYANGAFAAIGQAGLLLFVLSMAFIIICWEMPNNFILRVMLMFMVMALVAPISFYFNLKIGEE